MAAGKNSHLGWMPYDGWNLYNTGKQHYRYKEEKAHLWWARGKAAVGTEKVQKHTWHTQASRKKYVKATDENRPTRIPPTKCLFQTSVTFEQVFSFALQCLQTLLSCSRVGLLLEGLLPNWVVWKVSPWLKDISGLLFSHLPKSFQIYDTLLAG